MVGREIVVGPERRGRRDETALFLYFSAFILALGIAYRMPALPVQLYLKERLNFSAEGVGLFWLIFTVPGYVAFLFGFLRDRWSPFKLGDRGYLLLVPILGMGVFVWVLVNPYTTVRLLMGGFFCLAIYLMLNAVVQGQLAEVAQSRFMTGRLSVLWSIVSSISEAMFPLIGGALGANITIVFIISSISVGSVIILGILAPRSLARRERVVIEGERHSGIARIRTTAAELARCKPIWPIVAISLMASTASGIGGPILYYLRDTVHLTTWQVGMFSSIQWLAMIPGALAHAALCKRYPLGKLLMASVLIALPQLLTLLLLDSSRRLIPVAVISGALSGYSAATFLDLLLRACPRGLEATGMTLVASAQNMAFNLAWVGGGMLMSRYGYSACVLVGTATYALIIPMLWLVPRGLKERKEGEDDFEDLKSDS